MNLFLWNVQNREIFEDRMQISGFVGPRRVRMAAKKGYN